MFKYSARVWARSGEELLTSRRFPAIALVPELEPVPDFQKGASDFNATFCRRAPRGCPLRRYLGLKAMPDSTRHSPKSSETARPVSAPFPELKTKN